MVLCLLAYPREDVERDGGSADCSIGAMGLMHGAVRLHRLLQHKAVDVPGRCRRVRRTYSVAQKNQEARRDTSGFTELATVDLILTW